jgi:hypothetical protein
MTEPSSKEWSERRQLDELLRRRRTSGCTDPAAIEKSERPDFILSITTGYVGVEVIFGKLSWRA